MVPSISKNFLLKTHYFVTQGKIWLGPMFNVHSIYSSGDIYCWKSRQFCEKWLLKGGSYNVNADFKWHIDGYSPSIDRNGDQSSLCCRPPDWCSGWQLQHGGYWLGRWWQEFQEDLWRAEWQRYQQQQQQQQQQDRSSSSSTRLPGSSGFNGNPGVAHRTIMRTNAPLPVGPPMCIRPNCQLYFSKLISNINV